MCTCSLVTSTPASTIKMKGKLFSRVSVNLQGTAENARTINMEGKTIDFLKWMELQESLAPGYTENWVTVLGSHLIGYGLKLAEPNSRHNIRFLTKIVLCQCREEWATLYLCHCILYPQHVLWKTWYYLSQILLNLLIVGLFCLQHHRIIQLKAAYMAIECNPPAQYRNLNQSIYDRCA